jgi:hypothetical protein
MAFARSNLQSIRTTASLANVQTMKTCAAVSAPLSFAVA